MDRLAEVADRIPKAAAQTRQLARPEDDEHDREDDQKLGETESHAGDGTLGPEALQGGVLSTLVQRKPYPRLERPTGALLRFLVLSLLLHLLLLVWMGRAPLTSDDFERPPVVVKLVPALPESPPTAPPSAPAAPAEQLAAPQVRDQIVAPSDQENALPPLGRAYLSDRDNRVEQETVRRGNPEAGVPNAPAAPEPVRAARRPAPEPAPPPETIRTKPAPAPNQEPAVRAKPAPRPAPAPQRVARAERRADAAPPRSLPGLQELLPPPAEVLARARDAGAIPERDGAADTRSDLRRDLTGAPPPAPGLFAGVRGTFDDLPEVAPGSLTMLNTKADRFAPFVRRVGTRVFQNLLIYQRRDLDVAEILAANQQVTVRAILDPSGRLKNLEVIDRSGSHAVDDTLLDALREAAFDHNPPPEAANEAGEFEFLFQAQLSAAVVPGPKGPQLRTVESRLRIGLL